MDILYYFKKWGINIQNEKNYFENFNINFETLNKNPLIELYFQKINNNFINSNKNLCINCILYYIGGLLILLSNIEDLLKIDTFYNLILKCIDLSFCAVLVDEIIDTNNSKNIEILKIFFKNGNYDLVLNNIDDKSIIYLLITKLTYIINELPIIYNILIEGFNIELKSEIQLKNIDYNSIFTIETQKSDLFVKIFYTYLYSKEIEIPKKLGILFQVLDDFADYDDDLENGINTIVTYNILNNNIEEIYRIIFEIIDNLSDNFFLFKIISIFILQYKLNYHKLIFDEYLNKYKFSSLFSISNNLNDFYIYLSKHF